MKWIVWVGEQGVGGGGNCSEVQCFWFRSLTARGRSLWLRSLRLRSLWLRSLRLRSLCLRSLRLRSLWLGTAGIHWSGSTPSFTLADKGEVSWLCHGSTLLPFLLPLLCGHGMGAWPLLASPESSTLLVPIFSSASTRLQITLLFIHSSPDCSAKSVRPSRAIQLPSSSRFIIHLPVSHLGRPLW